jgi:hypothetical protein
MVPDGKIVNHGVDFIGGHTRPDERNHQVQGLDDQLAGSPYTFDLLRGFDPNPVLFGVLQIR